MLARNDEECFTDSELPMSQSRAAVSVEYSDMRVRKGKLRCMHMKLNCVVKIWNV